MKIKVQVPQQEPLVDLDPVSTTPAQQQPECVIADDAHDDVHGTGDENAPQQHEFDAEIDDMNQQPPVPEDPPIPLRRSSRDRVPSTKYPSDQYVVLLSDGSKPKYFVDAMEDEHKEWMKAMQEEMDS